MLEQKDTYSFVNVLQSPYKYQLREWRNQDFVRLRMINQGIISEEEHERYLDILRDSDTKESYVMMRNGNEPVGVANINWNSDKSEVESGLYLVHEEDLDSGLGVIIIWAINEYIYEVNPEVVSIGEVLKNNKRAMGLNRINKREDKEEYMITEPDGSQVIVVRVSSTKAMWERKDRERTRKVIDAVYGLSNIKGIAENKKQRYENIDLKN